MLNYVRQFIKIRVDPTEDPILKAVKPLKVRL